MEKKRAEWTKEKDFQGRPATFKVLNGDQESRAGEDHALFRRQHHVLRRPHSGHWARHGNDCWIASGVDFAILGTAEKDSGHDVRRFGEEMLFMALRDHNTASRTAIKASGVQRIVTADPHAFNALRNRRTIRMCRRSSTSASSSPAKRRPWRSLLPSAHEPGQRLRLSRSLLPRPPQPGLRRPARRTRCDPGHAPSGNEPLPRSFVLLRRRWLDAVLRAPGRTKDGREESADGGGGWRQRHRDGLPVLHGEYRGCNQSFGHGRQDGGHRPGGVGRTSSLCADRLSDASGNTPAPSTAINWRDEPQKIERSAKVEERCAKAT